MDLRDARMVGEVTADVATARDDAQHAVLDKWCESTPVDRFEVAQDWVELQHDETVVRNQ
ncbi:hypothetical protein [Streptomyces sp. NBC_00057]|uniref:hypothetical protein n=1 Tax=Streptomyces sp. NBC_00057 TaxID=2975634 RepID=UPI00324DAFF1